MGFACGYVGRVQYPVQYTYCIVRDVVQLCATLHFARNAFVQLEQAFLCGAYHFIMRDLQFDLVQFVCYIQYAALCGTYCSIACDFPLVQEMPLCNSFLVWGILSCETAVRPFAIVCSIMCNCCIVWLSTCARNAFVQVFWCVAYHFSMRNPQFDLV